MRSTLAFALGLGLATLTPGAHADCGNAQQLALAAEGDTLATSDLDGAIAKWTEAARLDPSNDALLAKLARAQAKKEDWAAARATITQAVKLAPMMAGYVHLLGVTIAQLALRGRATWPEAKEVLEEAVQLDPNLASAQHDLGEALLHLGDDRGALEHYGLAVKAKPTEPAWWAALADTYSRLRFRSQAEQVLREALGFVPAERQSALLLQLGTLLVDKGDKTGAVETLEQAKRSCGQCAGAAESLVFFELGMAYANASPPRKSEAMNNLQMFQKRICKGAAAQRFADACTSAQAMATKLGATLQ